MQPLEFYFKSNQFTKSCKIQTKCFVSKTVKLIKELKAETNWFTSHPQFRHFFHMPEEPNLKLQGMWMLLVCTICTEEDDVAWFAVNGTPIRYSMREHALICGLNCHQYPKKYLKLGGYKFVDEYFKDREKITIKDVKQKLLAMKPCNDRLKMAVLYFLGRVIRGKPKDSGPLDQFILRIVDNLEACRSFPWGRLTFEDAIKGIKHMMNHLKGQVHATCGFPGFIIPLEVLAFECIPNLGKTFRVYLDNPCEECPRMCKSRFTHSSLRGYPLEDIYAALGDTKVIKSVLVPTLGEEILLARIIDEEAEYDRQGSQSDSWSYWLNVKEKSIWWKELYKLDLDARVFEKKKEKEKVTFVQGSSSSDSGLGVSLKGLEERLLEFMGEGFVGVNFTVETKLESIELRMSNIEKNQRLLRKRVKKIEERLTSIEGKVNEEKNHGEDMHFKQWDGMDYDRNEDKDKENDEEKDKEDKEENDGKEAEEEKETNVYDEEEGEEDEQESEEAAERRREAADAAWRKILSESENDEDDEAEGNGRKENNEDDEAEGKDDQEEGEGKDVQEEAEINEEKEAEKELEDQTVRTPTPPRDTSDLVGNQSEGTSTPRRGRPKAMAARKNIQMKEKYTDEEKKKWVMVVYKGSEEMMDETNEAPEATPKKRGRPKRSDADGPPKKRGRPKRNCGPSRWVQSPFTEGKTDDIDGPKKKRKTKS